MEHHLYHQPGNPRNSEGAFVKLAEDRILFAYTRYKGESSRDSATADIASVVSCDGGNSWQEGGIIVKHTHMNVMSVSLLRLDSGRIALLYLEKSAVDCAGGNFIDCRPKLIFSDDKAATWSEPVDIAGTPPVYMCVNNDRMVQLSSGRLIVPGAIHPYCRNGGLSAGYALFYLSDDGGISWRESEQRCYPPQTMKTGLQEPGVIELADGRLMAWFRNGDGCQYKSFSSDRGDTWTTPAAAPEFLSPESPLSMKRHPVTGNLVAVWNDRHPLRSVRYEKQTWGRTPLVLAQSDDEGKSWKDHRVLEDDPSRGFGYIAMMFDGAKLFLAYCCGGGSADVHMLQDLKIRSVEL